MIFILLLFFPSSRECCLDPHEGVIQLVTVCFLPKRAGCSFSRMWVDPQTRDTQRTMAALLLWLLGAGALLFSSDALTEYDKLPENYKKGVDLALKEVNSHPGVQLHFLFFESVKKSAFEVQLS